MAIFPQPIPTELAREVWGQPRYIEQAAGHVHRSTPNVGTCPSDHPDYWDMPFGSPQMLGTRNWITPIVGHMPIGSPRTLVATYNSDHCQCRRKRAPIWIQQPPKPVAAPIPAIHATSSPGPFSSYHNKSRATTTGGTPEHSNHRVMPMASARKHPNTASWKRWATITPR